MITIGKICQGTGAHAGEAAAARLELYLADAERDAQLEEDRAALVGGPTANYWSADDGRVVGRWAGAAAGELDLEGDVDRDAFRALFAGLDPRTRDRLRTGRAGGPRHTKDGRAIAPIAAFDVTFSAPKSVSILYAQTDDVEVRGKVLAALRAGAEASFEYLQEQAGWSRRWDRALRRPVPCAAQLVAAQFVHRLARPVTADDGEVTVDPQLHVHSLVASSALREDGSWAALWSEPLYQHAAAAGAVGQAAMRRRLVDELGVQVRVDENGTFELSRYTDQHRADFSRRAAQVEALAEAVGASSLRGQKRATVVSRESKDEFSQVRGGVWPQLRRRLDGLGLTAEDAREHVVHQRGPAPRPDVVRPDLVVRQVGRSQWVFRRRDLVRGIAARLPSGATSRELRELVDRTLERQTVARRVRPDRAAVEADKKPGESLATVLKRWAERGMEQRWVTREVWDLERDMLRRSLYRQEDRVVSIPHNLVRQEMESWESRHGQSLTDGQRRMVREVCQGRGGVLVIEGRAGTGKTAAAEVVRCAFERAGLTIVGAALPGRAGVQLAQDSGIRSETIKATLQSLERGLALPRGSALLVDEAGMVGSADTAALVRYADEQGWKLVLIGDRAQLQPIDGGAAFRALGDRLGTVELDEVLRQKEPWQREAAAAIRTNRGAEAWAEYQARDVVAVLPDTAARRSQMVGDYLQLLDHGRDVVMLAHHRSEVDALNRIAHAAAVQEGRITDAASITVGDRAFRLGEPVVPRRRQRGMEREQGGTTTLENGDRMRLVGIEGNRMQLERESDQTRVWIDTERYQDLDWGYAITAHRGQGLTADAALISGDPSAWAQLLYTLATRQREEIRFYGVGHTEEAALRAEVAHPHAQDPMVPSPTWSQGMQGAFQRWEPAATSLDFQRGDDPEVAKGRSERDAARMTPYIDETPWEEIADAEDGARANEHVVLETAAEDHTDTPAHGPQLGISR